MTAVTEEGAAAVAVVAFCCYGAFGIGRWAATLVPLEWAAVAAIALIGGLLVWGPLMLMTGRPALVALALFVLAVVLGAHRGMIAREKTQQEDQAREARMLAYVATLGPCVVCASGDLQRRPCHTCGKTHCEACSLTHRRQSSCREP